MCIVSLQKTIECTVFPFIFMWNHCSHFFSFLKKAYGNLEEYEGFLKAQLGKILVYVIFLNFRYFRLVHFS